MTSKLFRTILSLAIGWLLLTPVASAATNSSSLEHQIHRELVTLPYYSLFDNVSFELNDSTVTLSGEVWWPALKKSAERVVG
ncbi:MAG: hypothetical protein V3R94_09430, partial [Acidobacteriota bacterium]